MSAAELEKLEAEEAVAWKEAQRIRTELLDPAQAKWSSLYRQMRDEKAKTELEATLYAEIEAKVRKELEAK